MSGKWLRWCGVLGGLGLAAGCARGIVPEYPPVVRVGRETSTEQAPVRILDIRFEYVFDDKGNWQELMRQSYRVLTRQGVETWGGTSAGWSPWYMARPELEAQVRDPGGAVRKLDLTAVAESPAYPELPDIYGDRRILRAPLPGVHVGSVVTEATRRKTTQPFFAGGAAFHVTFQSYIPRDAVELVVDLPASLPFNYELLDAQVRKEESLGGGRRRVVFRARQLDAIEPAEPYSLSSVPQWPAVAFSTGESWQQIASAYEDVMNERLEGAAGVAELARRSVTAGASDVGKANQLLQALHQRVRYVAVEFGQAAIVPASPEEVLRRTYGDCKDQALVLVAMLRAVGLPATLALLRAGPGEDVRPRLPALDVFNHAIVVVQTAQPFWIDPTSDHARAGELPEGDQGRLALVVDRKSRGLTLTPSLTSQQNGYLEVREIRLREGALTRVSEASSGTGTIEQRLRDSFAGSEAERERSLTEYVKKQYSADKLSGAQFDGLDDVRRPLRLTLDAEGSRVVALELFRAVVPVEYGLLTSWLPEPVWNDKPRRGDVRLPLRYQAEVRYRVVPPPHYAVRRLPELPDLPLGPARMIRRYEAGADGVVTASFKFEIDRDRLSLAELAQLKEGLAALDAEPKDEIELVHESELLFSRNQPRQAFQQLASQIKDEPRAARPLLRLATKLGELGFGRLAQEKARLAAALEPKSALAERTLGMLLQRDAQGRLQTPGVDFGSARAAFRRALGVDEDDLESKLWLASLLERDERGEKYRSESALDEAIELYDEVPEDTRTSYRDGFFARRLPEALLGAQRFDALVERREQLPVAYGIAAETHRAGVAAGVAYAERAGLVGEARSEAFATAASGFFTARRYPEASELYEQAARSGNGVKYAGLARILKSTKPVQPAQLGQRSPEAVALKAEVLAVVTGTSRLPAELLSSRAETAAAQGFALSSSFESLTGAEPSRAILADVRAATLRTSVSGSDALGFRVRITASEPSGNSRVSDRYVVKEAKGYGIVATTLAGVGCEALHRVAQGDAGGARQWLDWANEASESEAGDDPLRSAPFARLWDDGKGDAELAAAALCAGNAASRRARELLEKRRGVAGASSSALEHAIALGASAAHAYSEQLAAAQRLLKLHPSSANARELHLEALWWLGRFGDVEREARRQSTEKTTPAERWRLLQWRGRALAQTGKASDAQRVFHSAIEGSAPASLSHSYNESAWSALFVEPRPRDMREHAQRAVEQSQGLSYVELHTLACIQLDLGDVAGAQATFQRLLQLDTTPELSDSTRYVQGGLAEAYGLNDVAREVYRSVKPRDDGLALSSYALAQRRLAALDK